MEHTLDSLSFSELIESLELLRSQLSNSEMMLSNSQDKVIKLETENASLIGKIENFHQEKTGYIKRHVMTHTACQKENDELRRRVEESEARGEALKQRMKSKEQLLNKLRALFFYEGNDKGEENRYLSISPARSTLLADSLHRPDLIPAAAASNHDLETIKPVLTDDGVLIYEEGMEIPDVNGDFSLFD